MLLKNIVSFFLFIVFVSLLYFVMGNFQTAFSTQAAGDGGQSSPWKLQPTSIEDIDCGGHLVGGKFKIDESGRDFIQLYPETDRQFDVPIQGLSSDQSMKFDNATVFFEVNYPLEKGSRQGFFHFRKFVKTATLSEVHARPIRKIHENCTL